MTSTRGGYSALTLPCRKAKPGPLVWLGQSVRTTIVTRRYPALANECWMVSLGDAVHRPNLIERVFCGDLRERLAVRGPIMLDSGGFTMMMQNKGLRVSEVARIYDRTCADLCISLDVPVTRRERKQTRNRKYEETRANLAQLARCIDPSRLVPVVHGTTVEEVFCNCQAIADLVRQPPLICIGGLVPLLRSTGRQSGERNRAFAWIASMVATVRQHFPSTMIHVLGAGSPQSVAATIRCGADSTDSLAWRRAAGFGTIFLPGTSERFLQSRDRARATSRPTINVSELELLAHCHCPACNEWAHVEARVAGLSDCYLARAAHNAHVILQEAKIAAHAQKAPSVLALGAP